MAGDYSRFTFDPDRQAAKLLQQQGRVGLDADWNELVDLLDRRFRVESIDTVGRAAVPKETPDGFKISVQNGNLFIGVGRMYVDGLLVENRGKGDDAYDAHLGESVRADGCAYDEQPIPPEASQLPPAGKLLVYVDVWQREVTAVEDTTLIEPAVGVDTTTRMETVWQVKTRSVANDFTCASADEFDDWQPSPSRLTVPKPAKPADDNPCVLPPGGGYRGLENHLYRVEIVQGGPENQAQLAWSRDNASVAARVTKIDGKSVTVAPAGRDAKECFGGENGAGCFVEVTTDHLELLGKPGAMRKVTGVKGKVLTLDAALPAGTDFPTGAQAIADANMWLRRWDGSAPVSDATNAAKPLALESGVSIVLSLAAAGAEYRTGDYWVFAARNGTAWTEPELELLDHARPRGVLHHYARLATVTIAHGQLEEPADCRTLWPPECNAGCDCTRCVEGGADGQAIQKALDEVARTGGKVCLGPGIFHLREPLLVRGATSVQLQGHGRGTVLLYNAGGTALQVLDSTDVTISSLSVVALSTGEGAAPSAALAIQRSMLVRVQDCALAQVGTTATQGAAVLLNGLVAEVTLRDNLIAGTVGVMSVPVQLDTPAFEDLSLRADNIRGFRLEPRAYVLTVGLYVENNVIAAWDRGVSLEGMTHHLGEVRIRENRILGCARGAVVATGRVLHELLSSSHVDVIHNTVAALGDGIVIATDNTRVNDNDVGIMKLPAPLQELPFQILRPFLAAAKGDVTGGIVVAQGLAHVPVARCLVVGNRLTGLSGHGIDVRGRVASAVVKNNLIENIGGSGIVMRSGSAAGRLGIENNQIAGVGLAASDNLRAFVAAIAVQRAEQLDIASNTIDGVGARGPQYAELGGITVMASTSIRVSGNDLVNVGASGVPFLRATGIHVGVSFERADVVDNSVRRAATPVPDGLPWIAVLVEGAVPPAPGVAGPAKLKANALKITPTLLQNFTQAGPLVQIKGGGFTALFLPRLPFLPLGRELVAVRGNLLDGYGTAPALSVTGRGSAVIGDNRCLMTMRSNDAVIEVKAGAAVVNANYVERAPADPEAWGIRIAAIGRAATVVGNLSTGRIFLDPAELGDPWKPLNTVARGVVQP